MESNLVTALWKTNSRKVSFGLILYATSTALLLKRFIDAESWMLCMAAASTLVGGGTLADRWMNGKKNQVTVTTSSNVSAPALDR